MNIILLGPPGAGKGTQAIRLAKKLKTPHISTGDILRQNVSLSTELGMKARGFMEKGVLVPDELVAKMLQDRMRKPDVKNGFILDGYPRNINQAKALQKMLQELGMDIDVAFYLDADYETLISRLTGRLVCSNCGMNFHRKNMAPKVDMVCDTCGGKLFQRSDDKEETVKKRLEVYKEESSSLIDYYRLQGKLQLLDANDAPELVLQSMFEYASKGR